MPGVCHLYQSDVATAEVAIHELTFLLGAGHGCVRKGEDSLGASEQLGDSSSVVFAGKTMEGSRKHAMANGGEELAGTAVRFRHNNLLLAIKLLVSVE